MSSCNVILQHVATHRWVIVIFYDMLQYQKLVVMSLRCALIFVNKHWCLRTLLETTAMDVFCDMVPDCKVMLQNIVILRHDFAVFATCPIVSAIFCDMSHFLCRYSILGTYWPKYSLALSTQCTQRFKSFWASLLMRKCNSMCHCMRIVPGILDQP